MLPVSRYARRWPLHALSLVLAAVFLVGCAGSGGGSSTSPNVISEEAIQEVSDMAQDAYQVVNRIRPQWLRSRGVTSFVDPNPTTPVVYLNGTRHGDIDSLRRINSNSVLEIRYLSSLDAQTRFGMNHPGGALMVETRR